MWGTCFNVHFFQSTFEFCLGDAETKTTLKGKTIGTDFNAGSNQSCVFAAVKRTSRGVCRIQQGEVGRLTLGHCAARNTSMVEGATRTEGCSKVPPLAEKQTGSLSLPISMVLQSMVDQEWLESNSNSSIGPVIRKRQRLTHMSPQEKAHRRSVSPTTTTSLYTEVYLNFVI